MQALLDEVAAQWSDGAGENFDPVAVSDLNVVVHLDDGDRRVELFDQKGKKLKELGGDLPTSQPDAEEAGLLSAVYDEPSSDQPRRRYAEWLTRKGDPRGEFIALQLNAAAGKSLKKDEKRAASLLAKGWRGWAGPLADVLQFKECRFERGFLTHAFLTGDIRGKPRWNQIVGHPGLATLTSVECFLPDENAIHVLCSQSLKSLRHLSIRAKTLEAVPGDKVAWHPESLTVFYAQPDKNILDFIHRHPALKDLKAVALRLESAVEDVGEYHRLVLEHPLSDRLTDFSICCFWPDPDHRTKVASWLTPELRPNGVPRRLGLQARSTYKVQWTEMGWSALDVELGELGVGEFAQMASKLTHGRIRRVRVVGAQKIPDFHRTLVRAVEGMGPLEYVELPPAPPGA